VLPAWLIAIRLNRRGSDQSGHGRPPSRPAPSAGDRWLRRRRSPRGPGLRSPRTVATQARPETASSRAARGKAGAGQPRAGPAPASRKILAGCPAMSRVHGSSSNNGTTTTISASSTRLRRRSAIRPTAMTTAVISQNSGTNAATTRGKQPRDPGGPPGPAARGGEDPPHQHRDQRQEHEQDGPCRPCPPPTAPISHRQQRVGKRPR